MRHAGVLDNQMMDEIKYSVPSQGSGIKPQILLESDYGQKGKSGCHGDFHSEDAPRCSHYGEQHVVGGYHDEHGWVKRVSTIQPDHSGESSHRQRQESPN